MHGFDEWFGNLYHLNAEEDQKQSRFMKSFVVTICLRITRICSHFTVDYCDSQLPGQ